MAGFLTAVNSDCTLSYDIKHLWKKSLWRATIEWYASGNLPVPGELLERLVALVPLPGAEDEEGGGSRELRPVPLLDVVGGGVGDGAGDLVAEALGQARVKDRVLDACTR